MTRLLVLCEYPSLNGGERSLLTVLPEIRAAGFDLRVAAPSRGPLADALHHADVEVVPWDLRGTHHARPPLDEARQQLEQLLRRDGPRLIHANSLSMARIAGPVAQQMGIACLGHMRDILRLNRAAVRDLNCNRLLLAVSHATRDWHVQQGLSADRTRVVYNGVDLDRFSPRPATGWLHRELQLDRGAKLVGAIGQIGLRKGLDVWLDAARRIAGRDPEVRFLIVGQRFSQKAEAVEFEQRLFEQASAGPLRGRCFFLGVRDDIPQLLSELTLLMHAARQEPLGRVLLEAAAAGVPVVATQVGGTAEIFGSRAAQLVPADDATAMADAAGQLLERPELRAEKSAAARRRAERQFSRSIAANRLIDAYRTASPHA